MVEHGRILDISGFGNWMLEKGRSEKTVASYISSLKLYSQLFDEITEPNLIMFREYLAGNFRTRGVSARMTAILMYCKFKGIRINAGRVRMPKESCDDNANTAGQDRRQTLCWKCRNAVPRIIGGKVVRGCSWSVRFEPVKGWMAKEDTKYGCGGTMKTYFVLDCPEFAADDEPINILY